MSTRSRTIGLGLLIIIVGAAAYANSVHGVLVLDDIPNIVQSPVIGNLLPTRQSLLGPPWHTFTGRPVAAFTLALNYRIHGTAVEGYHLFNIVVHLLAGLTLWGVVRRTLRLPALRGRFESGADVLATLIALTWVVHPLTTSSVTYISQRVESLMGLFYLLTLYCFIRGATGRAWWHVLAVICCFLGMLTKEPMASAPLMVLLYDRTLLAGSFAAAIRQRRWMYAGLAAAWVPMAILLALDCHGPAIGLGFEQMSAVDYLKTQSKVIVHYLKLCFWPHPLIYYYGWAGYDVPILRSFWQYAPWAAVVLALVGLTAWALWKRMPVGLLGAWFFLILAPSSSIVVMPSEVISETRMYLPLFAVISVVLLGLHRLTRLVVAPVGLFVGCCLIVALAVTTHRRNQDYSSFETLLRQTVRDDPGNSLALGSLGYTELVAGRLQEAERLLRRSLEIRPIGHIALMGMGKLLEKSGRLNEAIDYYRQACRYGPEKAHYFMLLGSSLAARGDFREAAEVFSQALERMPNEPELLNGMAWILATAPDASLRNAGQAVQYAEKAVMLTKGKDASALDTLAAAYAEAGRFNDAISTMQQALKLLEQSDSPDVRDMRNRLELYRRGQPFRDQAR